mmetsp:Transcript_47324/g.151069  ORF Transcript_47324/g.151069 Transcript_47324/m.151069 type:complete len:210 (+) Transcript_47324:332-961(+)
MPTVTAEAMPASHVRFTWKTRTKIPPTSTSQRPAAPSAAKARHQAGCWRSPALPVASCTWPFSRQSERARATAEESESFSAVISAGETRPPRRLSGRSSSRVARRSVTTQSASSRGAARFTASGRSPASMPWALLRPTSSEPSEESSTASFSRSPGCSLSSTRATTTVQRRSVACSSRCAPVGRSCRPQFVTPYLRPKSSPGQATCRSL